MYIYLFILNIFFCYIFGKCEYILVFSYFSKICFILEVSCIFHLKTEQVFTQISMKNAQLSFYRFFFVDKTINKFRGNLVWNLLQNFHEDKLIIQGRSIYTKTRKSPSLRYCDTCFMHNMRGVSYRRWHDSLSM